MELQVAAKAAYLHTCHNNVQFVDEELVKEQLDRSVT